MRSALLLIVLAALWLLLSGFFTVLQLGLGLVSCALVAWLAVHLGLLQPTRRPLAIALRLPAYLPWLTREIVRSNLDVTRCILAPDLPIARSVVRLRPGQRTALGVAVYANSITLTPGTLTLDADGDELVVHALTRAGAQDLRGGEMDRRVCRLEGPG